MLLQILFALICLALGSSAGYVAGLFKIGWWFADEVDQQQAKASLKNLEALTCRVSGQVAEHARRVEDAQRELNSAGDVPGEQPLSQAAEALRTANEHLQAELRKAKRDLEKQAGELQSHRREARTDGLTQLLNRRAFDEEIDRLPQRIVTTGMDAALLLFDIDHFKQFNDTYGHQVGDRVIKHVADTVRQTLIGRNVVAARYGGEEFAVILASNTPVMAARVAEEVREAIEGSKLKHQGQNLAVTISIGLATTSTGLEAEHTVAEADTALYAAKRNGRNCGYLHDGEQTIAIQDLLHNSSAAAPQPAASPPAPTPSPVVPTAIEQMSVRVEREFAELEAALRAASEDDQSGGRERRKHERKAYQRVHQIAPILSGRVPLPEMFEQVQFLDISSSGFGMLLPVPPSFKNFVVSLDKPDGIVYALAEVVRMRRSAMLDASGRRLWEVGCRFTGRMQSADFCATSSDSRCA